MGRIKIVNENTSNSNTNVSNTTQKKSSTGRARIVSQSVEEQVELLDIVKGKEDANGRTICFKGEVLACFDEKKALALKEKLESLDKEIRKANIDPEKQSDKIRILMFLYGKFQRDIKYFNPSVMFNTWNVDLKILGKEFENVINAYGALVENYAMCQGIAEGMSLACRYFGIECQSIRGNNCGVRHAMNKATINGKTIYFDLSAEIGMNDDGKHLSKKQKRLVEKEKNDVTYRCFGRKKSGFAMVLDDERLPEGVKIDEKLKEQFRYVFFEHNQPTKGRIRVMNKGFDRIEVPKELED